MPGPCALRAFLSWPDTVSRGCIYGVNSGWKTRVVISFWKEKGKRNVGEGESDASIVFHDRAPSKGEYRIEYKDHELSVYP